MPFFFSEQRAQEAFCYFTIMSLNNHAARKSQLIFDEVKKESDWVYAIGQSFNKTYDEINKITEKVIKHLNTLESNDMVVGIQDSLYPKRLKMVDSAPPFVFMRGEPLLTDRPVISVVGSRNSSEKGINDARRLARLLSERRIIVASGLAKGIDHAAHLGTIDVSKQTIGVIGTPLDKVYPKEHEKLQKYIGVNGLLISQFAPGSPVQRWNFPQRNSTMSGISIATIVVEAGETSGALIQAREALKQGREVFIPQRALDNDSLKWPKKFVYEYGANKFTTIDDLMGQLESKKLINSLGEIPNSKTLTLV
jgi:DNA processing protein